MGGGQPIDGAVALVIGGAGGIGAAIASRLARGAADVVTADLPGPEAAADLAVCDLGARMLVASPTTAASVASRRPDTASG